ncbi:MAG: bifunctional adenosylcobinamide kinase/adenosylcobinamide-phosphate guanylyltransferase [Dehalococcoidales bacterium]|nr:bifunctional adenosylcobinamide kinase/adenosylcobinamide-phosphate guanylyltransferase [Dehalococcoidales bacterium]
MNKGCTLIVGGARSGKSRFAQELAEKTGEAVLFVATAEAGDEEMSRRIEKHRKSRPVSWRTLEATDNLSGRISREISGEGVVIIDCITLLVNNITGSYGDRYSEGLIEDKVTAEIRELIECIDRTDARFIIVSNEVGLGLVPPNKLGRFYRDILGRANQLLARRADEVYLMICGLPVAIKTPGRS